MDDQEDESEFLLFPNLVTTLETILQETNQLKHKLSTQIKEASSLTEWELPGDSDNESDEQLPLEGAEHVDGASVDNLMEEIVSESISSAIEHAQTVRKKLSLNKAGNEMSKTKLEQNSGKVTVQKPKTGNLKDKMMTIKTTNTKCSLLSNPLRPASCCSKNQKVNNSKTENKSTQPLPKRKSTKLQSTYQKDYLSVAKQMQTSSKCITSKCETTNSFESQIRTDSSKSKVFNFTDIDSLLSLVTPYPCASTSRQTTKKSITSSRNSASGDEVSASKRRTCKRQIDKLKLKKKSSLKEAIDVLGIPSELDSALKVYYKYLDHKKYYSEEEGTLKNEFLNQLSTQNRNEFISGLLHQPDMQAKVSKLLSIAENMEEDKSIDFKLDVESANNLLDGCFNSNEDLCLYYSDRQQLELLEKNQDDLMQLKLKLRICDSILNDLSSSEFEEKHIFSTYKVVSALKDINLLSVPVIFRK